MSLDYMLIQNTSLTLKFKKNNKMNKSMQSKNYKTLQINEEQVNKFYQERQIYKSKINPSYSVLSKKQGSQNEPLNNSSFKNLYRRKSLMHRLKEEDSMFTSFNNSVDYDRSLAQSILKKSTHRTVYENTFNEQNMGQDTRDEQKQNFQPNSLQKNHSSLQQHRQPFYDAGSSEPLMNRVNKRSNSVQMESSSMSFSGVRESKGTIPLSTILKKYQEEVRKLQTQNFSDERNESNFKSLWKIQTPNIIPKLQENNKDNFDTFNPNAHFEEEIYKTTKAESKLPQTVEKCIDKWRDLEIEQLKAERLYNRKKDISSINILYDIPTKFQTQQNENAKKKELDTLKQQYEQRLKQKDEQIKELENQNAQYKKFVLSMQKMKSTLEGFESDSLKSKEKFQKNKNSEPNNEAELNLKQLWRWIKSLPNKKKQQSKKQSVR